MASVTQRWVVAAVVGVLLLAVPSSAQQHVAMPPSSASAPAPAGAAAAPGPAAGSGGIDPACLNSLLNMSDCLPYVQAGSTARRPEKACCPELAGLVDSNPVCLCELLSGAADSYGITVDYSRAVALPGVCRVSTPPLSTCAAMGYNVTAGPSAAPAMAPAVSPSGEDPQFPAASPFASQPSTSPPSHATRRLTSAGELLALAVFSLAALAGGLL